MIVKVKAGMIVLCILLIVMISGCNNEEPEVVDNTNKSEKIQIGMSFDSFVIERWTRDKEIFVSSASAMGAEVNVQNANGELETQKEQIRYLIKKGMDVIVIIAVDSDGLTDVVNEARDADIKVIAYDRLINNAKIDLYISFDNRKVGVLMASALKEATGNEGRYIMLSGPTTDNNVTLIEQGFADVIKDTGIEVAGAMNADNWKPEYVYEYLEQHKDIVKDIDGIMCGNDSLATQTIRFLAENGLAGKIPVVGQDADLEACQHIVEGTQLMTVYKPVEQLAAKAAECAVQLGNNNTPILDTGVIISNGIYSCPYISLEPVAVDNSNIDETIIADGFHLKDEVYLNVSR